MPSHMHECCGVCCCVVVDMRWCDEMYHVNVWIDYMLFWFIHYGENPCVLLVVCCDNNLWGGPCVLFVVCFVVYIVVWIEDSFARWLESVPSTTLKWALNQETGGSTHDRQCHDVYTQWGKPMRLFACLYSMGETHESGCFVYKQGRRPMCCLCLCTMGKTHVFCLCLYTMGDTHVIMFHGMKWLWHDMTVCIMTW
jgi:hypothetical protein